MTPTASSKAYVSDLARWRATPRYNAYLSDLRTSFGDRGDYIATNFDKNMDRVIGWGAG